MNEVPVSGAVHLLCRLAELRETGCREFRIGAGDWPLRGFVVQLEQGVRAYLNRCPHLGYALNYLPHDFLGYDRRYLLCRMHGALFEKDSGLCIAGPCLGRSLTALPSRIADDAVVIDARAIADLPT
jgi:nitrite reductase/ring-hydroxylating ferredoxin subunit